MISWLNPVPAVRVRLLLAQGDNDAAAGWGAGRGLGPDDEPGYPDESAYFVLARVLLPQDWSDQALGILDRLHALATTHGLRGSVIKIQALRALAFATGDDTAPVVAAGLIVQLSHRELEVRLLAAGMANQEIATELYVCLNTVKSTSPTSSTSSARPAAPKPPPEPRRSAYSGSSARDGREHGVNYTSASTFG